MGAFARMVPIWVFFLLYPFLVPTYYRVTPGRLEVLGFSFLGSQGRIIEKVDLLEARVICRYKSMRMDFNEDEEGYSEVRINLRSVPAPREFAEAVFNASLCRQKAPTLPTDSLLG